MASMLSPAMSDQDLMGPVVTHYEPRIQACLISANVMSTQETLAVLAKMQSLENSREQYRATRRYFEHQEQTRGQPIDKAGNCRPNGNVQVHHARRDNRDTNHRGNPSRDPRTNMSRMSFFRGQGRLDDGTDQQLNALAREAGYFMLRSEVT
jgi:hypothetical protein